jgi:hypothetical protein
MLQFMRTNQDIEADVEEAAAIAKGNYERAESTARNHASLQALQIKVNAELIKTIRHLDEKNERLQKLIFWLSVIATIATIVALYK